MPIIPLEEETTINWGINNNVNTNPTKKLNIPNFNSISFIKMAFIIFILLIFIYLVYFYFLKQT